MSDFYYEQRKLELMHPSNLDENPYRGHSEKTEKSPEPKKKITQEYLTDSGFTPFCEDGELLFYQKFIDGGTVTFDMPFQGYAGRLTNSWRLTVKTPLIELKCRCSDVSDYTDCMQLVEDFLQKRK